MTIVSNLATGEPIWIGYGRKEETLNRWLTTLSKAEKKRTRLFAMDMYDAYKNAVQNDPHLQHAAIAHDPFHVMKRANQAIDELRRSVFFRAGPEMRAVGRGTRWLFLRAWERCSPAQKVELKELLFYFDWLLTMRDERARPLVQKFDELVLYAADTSLARTWRASTTCCTPTSASCGVRLTRPVIPLMRPGASPASSQLGPASDSWSRARADASSRLERVKGLMLSGQGAAKQ